MDPIVVAALYKFVTLDDYHALRAPLLDTCLAAGTRGTLLLAREGINGTIAGSREAVDTVLTYLRCDPTWQALSTRNPGMTICRSTA